MKTGRKRTKQKVTAWLRRGYTMIEVMMGLAILAVGAAGIVALQRYAVLGTMTSRHLTNATNISAGVIEQVSLESMRWTDNGSSISAANMPWLGTALTDDGDWVHITNHGFLIDGTPVDPSAAGVPVAYCTQIRAEYLGTVSGPGEADSARVEVRTFWAKSGRTITAECASWTGDQVRLLFENNPQSDGVTSPNRQRHEYGVVYLTTIVRRNST